MILKLIHRTFFKFGKNEIFENILPLKCDSYFDHLIKSRKQTFYLGIDPTANSLQIGNMFPLLALLRMWKNGHNIIVLIGGATGQIGDPTGRITDRVDLSPSDLEANVSKISQDINKIINNFQLNISKGEKLGSIKILNNAEWYNQKNIVTFLSEILKHFRFNDLRNKRSLEGRLGAESTMNMKEFFYPFLQAYDWLHLYREYGCRVQIGGDDQQGNMQLGQILIEKTEKEKVYGLTVPLFLINGEKVGKSNAKSRFNVWLNSDAQSPFSLHYTCLHLPNSIILNNGLLKRLTMLEEEEIDSIIHHHQMNPKDQIIQHTLADQVLQLVHGGEILDAVKNTQKLFSSYGDSFKQLLTSVNSSSSSFLRNIEFVPHISLNSNVKRFSANDLVALTKSTINTSNCEIFFNGESVQGLSEPLLSDSVSGNVCGVLQIGSGSKWIVVKSNRQ